MQSEIDRDINIRMPDGCDELPGKILKLAKSFHGLRQSSRVLNQLLMPKFLAFGLVRYESDTCIFRLSSLDTERVRVIVGVYVDGLIVNGEAEYCKKLRTYVQQTFPTKNRGAVYRSPYCNAIVTSRVKYTGVRCHFV